MRNAALRVLDVLRVIMPNVDGEEAKRAPEYVEHVDDSHKRRGEEEGAAGTRRHVEEVVDLREAGPLELDVLRQAQLLWGEDLGYSSTREIARHNRNHQGLVAEQRLRRDETEAVGAPLDVADGGVRYALFAEARLGTLVVQQLTVRLPRMHESNL